ncbi:MAG: hypothetical protein RIR68_2240, partial [Pseudomonadota bacterium]
MWGGEWCFHRGLAHGPTPKPLKWQWKNHDEVLNNGQ